MAEVDSSTKHSRQDKATGLVFVLWNLVRYSDTLGDSQAGLHRATLGPGQNPRASSYFDR